MRLVGAAWGKVSPTEEGALRRPEAASGGRAGPHTDGGGAGTYSYQSNATEPRVAYMPITRPVNPQATSVER